MSELSGHEAPTRSGAYNIRNTTHSQDHNNKLGIKSSSSESSNSSGTGSLAGSSTKTGLAGQPRATSRPATSGQAAAPSRSASGKPAQSDDSNLAATDHTNKARQQQHQQHQQHHHQTTTGSTRISSIEILNENKQRQLQFKQQESFKQHLEQRQKLIQQQHQLGDQANDGDLGVITYQVNTDAPSYVAMAAKGGATGCESGAKRSVGAQSGGIAVNPFEADADRSATVSGKSGFLSALMDEASFEPGSVAKFDDSSEELNSLGAARKSQSLTGAADTRYTKLVGANPSYNYDDDPSKRPFYERDLATLLQDCRSSRKLIIMIVAIALLLDNMLLTSVVPIIPAHLYKLRIERQHRDLLESNKSLFAPAAQDSSGRTGDQSRLDKSEDELLEAELDRRINQSLTNARDRFSGSVFHPRVRVDQATLTNNIRPGAVDRDDRDDRDGDQVNESGRGRDRSRLTGNRDDNDDDGDDDDDDDSGDDEAKDRGRTERPRKTGAMQQDSSSRKQWPARKLESSQPATDDDEYEDDNDDENGDDRNMGEQSSKVFANSTFVREDGRALKSGKKGNLDRSQPLSQKTKPSSNTGRGDNDNDEMDGDDEDVLDANRWQKLKASLASMARTNGNDTDTLGGMCLDYVLSDSINSARRPSMMIETSNGENTDGQRAEASDRPRSAAKSQAKGSARGKARQGGRTTDESITPTNRRQTRASQSGGRPRAPRIMLRPVPRRPLASTGTPPVAETSTPPVVVVGKDEPLIISHQDIVDESFEVGVMFASKPIVQAFANPFIGTLTNKVGFTIPMFTGFVIMFLSTLVFAFGSSYSTLFVARAIQGVGSACTSVAGMSMLADRFPDDAERGNAMAIALGGLALGVVIGPPFGGFMYEFVGKSSPFIVLAVLALLDGLLQLLVLQPRVTENQEEGASLMTLIKDPYILVAAGAITFANTGIAILEPALPLWMMDTMQAKNWEQGVAFLPAALSYMFGTNLFGNLGHKIGRWRATMIGLVIIGCSLLLIPFATRVDHLIIPNGAIGFAMGMVDSTMMPMLGYLVDIRHTSVYGSVYAIGDVAFCASFAFGPALSGTLVELIGFEGLIITTAIICFAFAPLLLLLRNPPARQLDEAQLQEQSSLRYVNYSHLDSPDEEAQLTGHAKSNQKTYVR